MSIDQKPDTILDGPDRLVIDDLVVSFATDGGDVNAVKGVSLKVFPGEILALVGESGSGKTTLGRGILGLVPIASGTVTYDGRDITHVSRRERRGLAKEIQVVFQDPYSSLNPSLLVSDILSEPLRAAGVEPVSALDLSTQARVLDLLVEIQERTGVALLVISHDLSVVRAVCHRVAVMYHGEIVEQGTTAQVIDDPQHDYTKRLLLAAPVSDPDEQQKRREARRLLNETALAADRESVGA